MVNSGREALKAREAEDVLIQQALDHIRALEPLIARFHPHGELAQALKSSRLRYEAGLEKRRTLRDRTKRKRGKPADRIPAMITAAAEAYNEGVPAEPLAELVIRWANRSVPYWKLDTSARITPKAHGVFSTPRSRMIASIRTRARRLGKSDRE